MPPVSGKAQLFTDVNFQGAYATLEVGSYNIGEVTGAVKDDSVSSLTVADGYQVTAYTGRDSTGAAQVLTTDTPRLSADFNDTISSVVVAAKPSAAAASTQNYDNDGREQVVFVQPPSY